MAKLPYLTDGEIADAPTISLGGRAFSVPQLGLKQNRVVVGGLKKLLPLLAELEKIATEAKAALDAGGDTALAKAGMAMLDNFPIDDDSFVVLSDVVYAALTRAYPEIGRAEFENMPIAADELLMAVPVIMGQSFAFNKKAPSPQGEGQPGTSPATTQPE